MILRPYLGGGVIFEGSIQDFKIFVSQKVCKTFNIKVSLSLYVFRSVP